MPPAWGPCKQGNRRKLRGRCSKRSISSQGSTPSLIPVGRWTNLCFSLVSLCHCRPLLSPSCPLSRDSHRPWCTIAFLPSLPICRQVERICPSPLSLPPDLFSWSTLACYSCQAGGRRGDDPNEIPNERYDYVLLSSSRHPIPCLPCPPASVGLRPIARIMSRPEYGVGCCTCTSASPPSYPPPA